MNISKTEEATNARKLVFLSYASQDALTGRRIVEEIEASGIPCWVAPRDVPLGANYGLAIIQGIEAAEVVLALLSSHANESLHVANEIERAVNYRKTILPIRIEDVKPSRDIELHISARQWLDLFRSPKERETNMNLLISRLRNMLRSWLVPELPPMRDNQMAPSQSPSDAVQKAGSYDEKLQDALAEAGRVAAAQSGAGSVHAATAALPESNPNLRQTVEVTLKEARQDGQNVAFLAAKLFGSQGVPAAGEICLLLLEGKQEYWAAVNAVRFLKFSLSQPGVRQFDRLVLQTLSAALAAASDIRNAAIDLLRSWPVQPKEKWTCLMEWLWAATNSGGAVLVDALVDTTPGDRRAETGAAITNLILSGDEALIRSCIAGIQRLNYRSAIPNLRELVETTLSANVALAASTVLATWRDTASAPAIRSSMEQVRLNCPTFGGLAKALRALEGEDSALFVADHFLEVSVDDQVPLLEYSWLDEFSYDAFIKLIVKLEATTANLKLKNAAQKFLAKNASGTATAGTKS